MNRNKWIAVATGILVVGFFLYGGAAMDMFKGSVNSKPTAPGATVPSGLMVQDRIVGTGEEALQGSVLTVHYVGILEDGTQFDSSIQRGAPYVFRLGAGEVIPGWDEGLAGMKVGGRRLLVIPPELAYGEQARGPIPANATLVFEVELLSVSK